MNQFERFEMHLDEVLAEAFGGIDSPYRFSYQEDHIHVVRKSDSEHVDIPIDDLSTTTTAEWLSDYVERGLPADTTVTGWFLDPIAETYRCAAQAQLAERACSSEKTTRETVCWWCGSKGAIRTFEPRCVVTACKDCGSNSSVRDTPPDSPGFLHLECVDIVRCPECEGRMTLHIGVGETEYRIEGHCWDCAHQEHSSPVSMDPPTK